MRTSSHYPDEIVFHCTLFLTVVSFIHLFEHRVGRFIKNTPLINLIYVLMGAKINLSASIDTFVREFDLVEVGEG